MIQLLAGIGIMFVALLAILLIYLCVSIIKVGRKEQMPASDVIVAVSQLIGVTIFGLIIMTIAGWIFIEPFMTAVVCK